MHDNNDINYPVMLSICVPTYNHEKYIRQALESVFMQETQYSYEILVGEDKSTDNTKQILQDIEKENHPGLKVFYREVNLNNTDCRNSIDLMDRARGKYLIFLEGDDYWTDADKIENQIIFLEKNPDYIAVAHNCTVVNEYSEELNEQYQECHDEEYTWEHYACEILPGQTASVLMRNFKYLPDVDLSLIRSKRMPGDRKSYFTLLSYGRIHCIQKKMSAYRHVTSSGESWSAKYKYDYEDTKNWHIELLDFSKKIKNQKAYLIADYLLYAAVRQAFLVHHKLSLIDYNTEIRKVDHCFLCSRIMFKRDFNRYILKKKVFFPKVHYEILKDD